MPVYIEKTDIGTTLTTWIYCAMWQLYALEQNGLQGYINWPQDRLRSLRNHWDDEKFAQMPNGYDWYLKQPHLASAPAKEEVWTWEDTHPFLDLGKHQLYGLPIVEIKAFYKRNCVFNNDVNARGAALAAKYSINFDKTIGITWRGTDCVIDGRPRMPIETYFPFIDEILTEEPDLRLMCTAEEETILDPLLKRYANAFVVNEFFMTPLGSQQLGDNPERFSTLPGFLRGMQPALMVYLFSRCKHYIKNRSSTGAVASWLSTGRIVCLAHPENLGHGFDITKGEINGKIFSLKDHK